MEAICKGYGSQADWQHWLRSEHAIRSWAGRSLGGLQATWPHLTPISAPNTRTCPTINSDEGLSSVGLYCDN